MTDVISYPSISYAAAARLVDAAMSEAAAAGVRAVVSVVDPALALVAYGRADGATPHSVETSRRKANTSASTRRPSGWMQGTFALELPLATATLLTNIEGGVPVAFDGVVVGGLGVAGGTPAQDAAIARAALITAGADALTD